MRTRFIIAFTLLLLASCGTGTLVSTIPMSNTERLELGSDSYRTFCAACHGTDLRGTDLGSSLLSIVYEPSRHDDAAFVIAIKDGVEAHHWDLNNMPRIAAISDQETSAVIAYIRHIQNSEGFED